MYDVLFIYSHIQLFWEVLSTLNPVEKSKFINFCSGRSRLPISITDYSMNFKLVAPPPQSEACPDSFLPVAQTCFFSLSLPKYSTFDICYNRLIYAITNAELIDADFNGRNASGWENIR